MNERTGLLSKSSSLHLDSETVSQIIQLQKPKAFVAPVENAHHIQEQFYIPHRNHEDNITTPSLMYEPRRHWNTTCCC
jgi:hypothetical protein